MTQPVRQLSEQAWRTLSTALGPQAAVRGPEVAQIACVTPAPSAVFRPRDSFEVSLALRCTREERLPVVVRGTGSRLNASSHFQLPANGYALLDLVSLAGVEETQSDSLWLKAKAATPIADARQAAAQVGCRLAGVDAEEQGSVAGWLTRHGRIADPITGGFQPPVLSLEAVLASGEHVRSVQTPRAATGPELFSLFWGTEGVFGVLTRLILKLEPLPERSMNADFLFARPKVAGEFLRLAACRLVSLNQPEASIQCDMGRFDVAVRICCEGEGRFVDHALQVVQKLAQAGSGRLIEDYSFTWPTEASPAGNLPALETSLRWSVLENFLCSLEQNAQERFSLILDKPETTGCRVRWFGPKDSKAAACLKGLASGSERDAVQKSLQVMAAIRQQLDPDGLINPHQWPLPWIGGAR